MLVVERDLESDGVSSTIELWRSATSFVVPPHAFATAHWKAFADGPSAPETSTPNAMKRSGGMS